VCSASDEAPDASVTKLVRGKTLGEAIAQAESVQERLALLPSFVALCRSVACAHEKGMVHRSLHPGKVLLGEFGETVVLDWAIAKTRGHEDPYAADIEQAAEAMRLGEERRPAREDARPTASREDARPTASRELEQAAAYMAPEMALGQMEKVDARSDVYALGAILYGILTGRAPYVGEGAHDVIAKLIADKPEPALEVEPVAPEAMAAICERAMRREPTARYASCKQLVEELEKAAAMASAAAGGMSAAVPNRMQKPLLGGAVAVIVIVLCLGVSLFLRVVQQRDEALLAGAAAQRERAAAETEREQVARTLEETEKALRQAQEDIDHTRVTLSQTQKALEAAEDAREEAEDQLADAREAREETEKALGLTEPPAPAPEPAVAEAGSEASPPERPPKPEQTIPAQVGTNLRPPGLTRAELAKALPELLATVKIVPTEDKAIVMVSVAQGDVPEGVRRLGFKDGDVITRVNRDPVDSIDQLTEALHRVKDDSGFTVRVTRGDQSTWMRINVREARPPVVKEPPQEAPGPPEGEAAPLPEAGQEAGPEDAPETEEAVTSQP